MRAPSLPLAQATRNPVSAFNCIPINTATEINWVFLRSCVHTIHTIDINPAQHHHSPPPTLSSSNTTTTTFSMHIDPKLPMTRTIQRLNSQINKRFISTKKCSMSHPTWIPSHPIQSQPKEAPLKKLCSLYVHCPNSDCTSPPVLKRALLGTLFLD